MRTTSGFALLAAAAMGGCATSGDICSDYQSSINCIGRPREIHSGIDLRGAAGTEVISATHGTVVRKAYAECPGHGLVVRTDIVAQRGEARGAVYAWYWHAEAIETLRPGQQVAPGDVIARIIPLRHTKCYGSTEHVHYELRVGDPGGRHIDPHQFWASGPGNVSCFTTGMSVPPGKAVAPLRCAR